jgi:hypothetical protein
VYSHGFKSGYQTAKKRIREAKTDPPSRMGDLWNGASEESEVERLPEYSPSWLRPLAAQSYASWKYSRMTTGSGYLIVGVGIGGLLAPLSTTLQWLLPVMQWIICWINSIRIGRSMQLSPPNGGGLSMVVEKVSK